MSARTAVVVPCYNEAARLDRAVFREFSAGHPDVHFYFVDDGSTDRTADVLASLAAGSDRMDVHRLERNSGKAEAVRQGVLRALEDGPALVGFWDADLATPLDAIPVIAADLDAHPAARLAMGSRVQLLGRAIRRKASRHYIGRVLATITAASMGVAVYDTQCGAKLLRVGPDTRALFDEPFMSRWLFDVELIMRILVAAPDTDPGALVREVPLARWTEVPGSKVGMRDGFRALADLQRIRRRYGRRGAVL